jgi:hypothetical protein
MQGGGGESKMDSSWTPWISVSLKSQKPLTRGHCFTSHTSRDPSNTAMTSSNFTPLTLFHLLSYDASWNELGISKMTWRVSNYETVQLHNIVAIYRRPATTPPYLSTFSVNVYTWLAARVCYKYHELLSSDRIVASQYTYYILNLYRGLNPVHSE